MKKILLIANYKGPIGGISGQVEQLKNCLTAEPVAESRESIVDSQKYEAEIFSTQGNVVKRLWKFIELIFKARKYDVLHIHGCSERGMLPIVYGVIAGKIWKKRIIATYHGGDADKYFAKRGAFARRWLKRADKVIVLNGYLEKVFAKYEIPCIVIPNIIELNEAQEHSAYKWDKPRLISVRHLRELYNIPCILRAYAIVKEQVSGATLTILGDGPMRAELERLVVSGLGVSGLANSVKFVGQVKSSEMAGYLAQSDIMLSAPRIDNMPVSVMEAMNAGVLVISSRVGGVPYLVEDQKAGLLFDLDAEHLDSANLDAARLAEKIMWAVEHQKECEAMIAKARQDVTNYSWNEVKKQILPLYN